jgi:signal transduction histidine kinase
MRNNKQSFATGCEVLLCAPFGKDAEILAKIVSSEGLNVVPCQSLKDIAGQCRDETDSIFLTEEALVSSSFEALEKFLRHQEPWSDIPIVLFASAGARPSEWLTRFLSKLGDGANVSILERPVRTPTILSVLRTAKRARARQRELRDLLLLEKHSAANLRIARDELERRVQERTSELSHTNLELNREIKERKRAEADLRSLAAKVLKVQDEERRRIARDLHDGVGQTLAGALMAVAQARSSEGPLPAVCGSGLRQAEELLQHATREVRTVSHLLHPPLLDESGLMSAIRWYVEEFSKRSRVSVNLELDEERNRLSQEVKTAVFRIIQEALTNVYRHSHAQAVWIDIKCDESSLLLRIKDDGKGIPAGMLSMAPNGKTGVGLTSMRERSTLLGGTFRIQSNGGGTTVSVTVPIQRTSNIASA